MTCPLVLLIYKLRAPCRRYKAFLDSITPSEFFEDKMRKLRKRRNAITSEWEAGCEAVRKMKSDAVDAKAQAEHDYEFARRV